MPFQDSRLLQAQYHPDHVEHITGVSDDGAWMFTIAVDPKRLNESAVVELLRMTEAMDPRTVAVTALRLLSSG